MKRLEADAGGRIDAEDYGGIAVLPVLENGFADDQRRLQPIHHLLKRDQKKIRIKEKKTFCERRRPGSKDGTRRWKES